MGICERENRASERKGGYDMGREKEGYRDMLAVLAEKYPLLLSRTQAGEVLGISQPHLRKLIQKKQITVKDGKIPIGSVINYSCG